MKYKILALGEIGHFLDCNDENFHCVSIQKKNPAIRYKNGRYFSIPLFFEVRKKIKNGYYDLILCGNNPYPIHIHDRSLLKNIRNFIHMLFFDFPALGLSTLPLLLGKSRIPVAGINSDDRPRIQKEDFYLLGKCNCYFMRELPQNKALLFLNANKRSNDLHSIKDNKFYNEIIKKIYPISLGVPDEIAHYKRANLKNIDIFFCGNIVNSTVRQDGFNLLNKLEDEGYKVLCITDRIPFPEFYNYCSRSWLVWSPNGFGWDCLRHYEICMAESVPVINYPTIIRYQPLMEGEHCFYYGVEGEHLYNVIKNALKNKDRLKQMGETARKHCLQYHTRSKILQYIIETTQVKINTQNL
ncbi:MAG: glycosyltransferase [Smithella sp.]